MRPQRAQNFLIKKTDSSLTWIVSNLKQALFFSVGSVISVVKIKINNHRDHRAHRENDLDTQFF